jgi:hypothetical protein
MSKARNLVKLVQSISTQGVLNPTAVEGSSSGYINLSMNGVLLPPSTGVSRFYPPTNITITNVYANLANSADGTVIFTLKKNGVSTGTTFTIPSGTIVMTPVVISVSLTTTDYLTLDTAGTATTARDLYVRLKYS